MPFIGSIIPRALVSGDQRAQQVKRDKDKDRAEKPGEFKRVLDEADLTVRNVESAESVRSVKSNDNEESHEDRAEHAYYLPGGGAPGEHRPKLDVEG